MRKATVLAPAVNNDVNRAEVIAVEALDALTGRLIKTHCGVPAEFLDWVGTDATNFAQQLVRRSMKEEGFARAMQSARAEVAILRLVADTVMPLVRRRLFETMATRIHFRSGVAGTAGPRGEKLVMH
nr:hypothetical protein [uncultured Rhodoferax sp.]